MLIVTCTAYLKASICIYVMNRCMKWMYLCLCFSVIVDVYNMFLMVVQFIVWLSLNNSMCFLVLIQLESALKAAETAQSSLQAERANSRVVLFTEEEIKSLQLQVCPGTFNLQNPVVNFYSLWFVLILLSACYIFHISQELNQLLFSSVQCLVPVWFRVWKLETFNGLKLFYRKLLCFVNLQKVT